MRKRRNASLIELDASLQRFIIAPVRGPTLVIASIMLAAALAAAAVALGMRRHEEAVWALAIVWAVIAIAFVVQALWPGHQLRVDLARGITELDGRSHALAQSSFTYEVKERWVGRRRVQYCVVWVALPELGSVKLLELAVGETSFAHNLVAGLRQAQASDSAAAISTLSEAIEYADDSVGKEARMVAALLIAPSLVVWLTSL